MSEAPSRGIQCFGFDLAKGDDRTVIAPMLSLSNFQPRVSVWMDQCFPRSVCTDMTERGDRLLEEVLELLQSKGYDRRRVATLADYVYGRPPGEPAQEVGGVMVTLAAYCRTARLDMHADGEAELARIARPEAMAKIRAKQAAKNALHFDTPLPGNAAGRDPEADYYVLVRNGICYVKEGHFFESQGGRTAEWGKAWLKIRATSIDDARVKGLGIFGEKAVRS